MIFTIGYDSKGLTPADLTTILDQINATLVDVREKSCAGSKGWGSNQLRTALGDSRYVNWKDPGFGAARPDGLEWLKRRFYHLGGPHCILLGKEENPGACHRHRKICADRFPDAMHIFRSRLISAEAWDNFVKRGEVPETIPISELQQFVENCESFEESAA